MDNIQIKTGKTAQDFWKLAGRRRVFSSAVRLHHGTRTTRNEICGLEHYLEEPR